MFLEGKRVPLQKGDKIVVKNAKSHVLISVVNKDGKVKTWGSDDEVIISMAWNQVFYLLKIMISSAGFKEADIIKKEERVFVYEIKD